MTDEAAAPKTRPDFSWEALKDHTIEGHPSGAKTLQDYWRLDPATGQPLDDGTLRGLGLIDSVDGVFWHIVHQPVPDSWKTKPDSLKWGSLATEIKLRLAAADNGLIKGCVLLDGAVLEPATCLPAKSETDGVRCVSLKDAVVLGKTDFAGWRFGEGTAFAGAEFLGDVSFADSQFHGNVNFSDVRFAAIANFGRTRFHKGANFNRAQFEAWNFFEGAHFLQDSSFEDAWFHEYALFKTAVFHKDARFRYATFFKKADFHRARFLGPASFERAEFFGVAAFLEATFAKPFSFKRAMFKHLCEFYALEVTGRHERHWRSAFDGAEISGLFNLAKGPFRIISAFNGAIVSGWMCYPIADEGTDVKAFRSEALNLAKAAGMESQEALSALEGGARVLKRAMAQQADSLREHQFYRFEIEARRHIAATPVTEKLVSWVYSHVAEYGRRVGKPLACLVIWFGAFAALYWLAACWMAPVPGMQARTSMALEASALGIVRPFFAWDPRWLDASAWRSGFQSPWTLLLFQIVSTVQSLTSIGLIFLSALAVRRRFQIS